MKKCVIGFDFQKASKEALAPTPVEKRQRWRAQKIQKKIPTKEAPPSPKPAPPQRKTSDWIFDAEDFSEPLPEPEPEVKGQDWGLFHEAHLAYV